VLLPQIGQILDLKLGQMKTELKQELIGTISAKVNEVKDDLMSVVDEKLTSKVEAMEAPLKSELQAGFEQQIVSTSTSIVQDIIVPDLDQKLSNKVDKLKEQVMDDLRPVVAEMKAPLKSELQASFGQQIVSTSTAIVQDIIVPDLDQKFSNKVDKDDLKPVIEEMKATLKTELKTALKTDMDQQIMDRNAKLRDTFQQQIVSTSTSIVQDIIVPDLDQKLSNKVDKLKEQVMDDLRSVVAEMNATPDLDGIVTASSTIINQVLVPQTSKVNQVKEVVKDELKSELDQDLKAEMTQQIASKIIERQEEVDGKVIFSVARKTDAGPGTKITFDTVIANIGDSMNNSTGTFTARRSGLYLFMFSARTSNGSTKDGGFLQVQVQYKQCRTLFRRWTNRYDF